MKTSKKTLFLFFMACMGFGTNSYAQSLAAWNDTMMVFRTPLIDIIGFEGFSKNDFFLVADRNQVQKIHITTTTTLGIPRTVRKISNPFLLQKDGKCYQLEGSSAANCGDYRMLWWDKNEDQKVQPRQEVRCVCMSDFEVPCILRWREILCE